MIRSTLAGYRRRKEHERRYGRELPHQYICHCCGQMLDHFEANSQIISAGQFERLIEIDGGEAFSRNEQACGVHVISINTPYVFYAAIPKRPKPRTPAAADVDHASEWREAQYQWNNHPRGLKRTVLDRVEKLPRWRDEIGVRDFSVVRLFARVKQPSFASLQPRKLRRASTLSLGNSCFAFGGVGALWRIGPSGYTVFDAPNLLYNSLLAALQFIDLNKPRRLSY